MAMPRPARAKAVKPADGNSYIPARRFTKKAGIIGNLGKSDTPHVSD